MQSSTAEKQGILKLLKFEVKICQRGIKDMLWLCFQAQDWPIRLRSCTTSSDCYVEGECCQRQSYASRTVCLSHGGCTDKCIGYGIGIIPSVTVPVDPSVVSPGNVDFRAPD